MDHFMRKIINRFLARKNIRSLFSKHLIVRMMKTIYSTAKASYTILQMALANKLLSRLAMLGILPCLLFLGTHLLLSATLDNAIKLIKIQNVA